MSLAIDNPIQSRMREQATTKRWAIERFWGTLPRGLRAPFCRNFLRAVFYNGQNFLGYLSGLPGKVLLPLRGVAP